MPAPTRRRYFNWTLFNRLAKVLVVLLIVALAIQSISALWFDGRQNERAADEQIDPTGARPQPGGEGDQFVADLTSGAWQFGQSEWDFRIYSKLSAPSASELPLLNRQADPRFDDQSVIAQFKDLGVQPVSLGEGVEKWETEGMGFRMTLFTRNGIVQLMRTELPVEQGLSTIEATPRRTGVAPAQPFLLPLIVGANQIAVRLGPNGKASSAIIHLNAKKQIDILQHWKENGWLICSAFDVLGIPERIDERSELAANSKFRCTKDGMVVEATFLSEQDNPRATIILTLIAPAH